MIVNDRHLMTTMPLKNFYNDQISYITRFVESVDNENFAL